MTEDGSTFHAEIPSAEAWQRVGEQLRSGREALGLSISEAGRRLNLAGSLIEDLEAGRTDRMAGLYRRGYIRNYSRLLGLDPAVLLAEVEPDRPPELKAVMPAGRRAINLDRFFKIATYVVVSIAIIPPLVFFYVQSGSRMAERDPSVTDQALELEEEPTPTEQRVAERISRALALDQPSDDPAASEPGHMSASVLPLAAGRPVRDPVVESSGSAGRIDPAADS
ncbi:MAG: helix-turn-helix domain-containing protein, partial [Wenzhouxiangella sp.]|nr:helix-turn-helix domain-containing protein [Wenzhouxiangella sp.]